MAQDKKSFVAYVDWKNTFDMLSNEEAGKLIKHLLKYVNDENPELDDRLLKLAFEPIKLQLKRDLKQWEDIRLKRVEAGKKGGVKSGKTRSLNEAKKANEANASFVKQNEANEAVNVNGNVTVNVNDKSSKSHYGDKSPNQKKEIEHWKLIVDIWFEFYKSKFETEPTFNATAGKNLKSILARIEKLSKKKNLEWTETTAKRSFDKFLENAWSDTWMQQNFLLTNLSSKFDSITNKKTEANGTGQKNHETGKSLKINR